MKIIAIDAGIAHSIVSRSVECAAVAAETAGADVRRVRLSALNIYSCTGCRMCSLTGACKITDDLVSLAESIAEADGVIFGVPSYFRRAEPAMQALLDRLASYFSDDGQLRLPGFSEREVPSTPVARATRRAIVITATAAPEPMATFFGYTTGPIRELRSALGHGGIRLVGSLAVAGTWSRPALDEWERDKAASLGHLIAGKV